MTEESNKPNTHRIDPDPVSVAALFVSGCALILQFIQTARTFSGDPSAVKIDDRVRSSLDSLRDQAEKAHSKCDRVIRYIERGSKDADKEFFEARFRLDQGALFLDPPSYDKFRTALAEAFTAIGGLSLWINFFIEKRPALAAQLGHQLSIPLSGLAEEVNSMLSEGKANRIAMEAINRAFSSLLDAIDGIDRGRN